MLMQLWRYPVKSMLGERLDRAEVLESGIAGDRGRALVDTESGKVVSAKNPRLWAKMLTLCGGEDSITTLDGRELRGDEELSAFLGRSVRLSRIPPEMPVIDRADPDDVLAGRGDADLAMGRSGLGTGFHDFAPIHFVTTATLGRVSEVERYRPNLVLDVGGDAFQENAWVGRELRIGEVVLSVVVVTPRCAVPTLAHGHLPRDVRALRVPAEQNRLAPLPSMGPQPCVGAYARVVRPGRMQLGDSVM